MRRLYIIPRSVWSGKIQTGTKFNADAQALPGMPTPPASEPVMQDVLQLFHPMIGAHYIDLPGDMLLLCTSFAHNEAYEDLFHSIPDVAILPNPTLDGTKALAAHVGAAGYKFAAKHLLALTQHPGLGVVATDTILDVARKAQQIHPEVRIRHTL